MGLELNSLKPSRYNFWAAVDPGLHLLFNGASGALISLDAEEKQLALSAMTGAWDATRPDIRAALVDGRFLMPMSFDEAGALRKRARLAVEHQAMLDLDICPTYACNFRCRYCFVDFEDTRMDPATESKVARFLERHIPQYRSTRISWSGGEPLLCVESVLRLSSRASYVASEHGRHLDTTLLTNGYLLNTDMAIALWSAGIHRFHVTLDGTAEYHDRLRPLADGAPTSRQIMSNVLGALDALPELRLNLRINIKRGNCASVPHLLSEIPREFRSRIQVDVSPIAPRSTECGVVDAGSISIKPVVHALLLGALRQGYLIAGGQTPLGTVTHCTAECRGNFHIAPDGSLHKCGPWRKPEARMGYIDETGIPILSEAFERWHDGQHLAARCEQCHYLCFCAGGCPVVRMRGRLDLRCTAAYTHLEKMIITLYHRQRRAQSQCANRTTTAGIRQVVATP